MPFVKIEYFPLKEGDLTKTKLIPYERIVDISSYEPPTSTNAALRVMDRVMEGNPLARSVLKVDEGAGSYHESYFMPQTLEEIAACSPGLIVLGSSPEPAGSPARAATFDRAPGG